MRRTLLWSCLLVAATFAASPVRAAGELAPAASASAAAGAPLPDLPRLAPITPPEPDPTAVRELDRLLEQITSHDARARQGARGSLEDLPPGMLGAIRLRVQDIRGSLDREEAPQVLGEARKLGRKSLKTKGEGETRKKDDKKGDSKDEKRSKKKAAEEEEGDWLDFMLAAARPDDPAWRDVVKLLAMNRMLAAIGTTPAVRELIAMHAYFGDMLRIDLQRHVAKLRDKAVPALIEARQHDAKIVQRWANRQLDLLGRAIPGEAVSTNDTQILADVLRAYGRTRDVDAVRVILSFVSSDRERLREAAREALSAIGEPGIWQLRDAYLNLTGSKPPREWTWDRIARELFAAHDRARLAEVYALMDQGVAAAQAGKHEEATAAFDKVLARSPLFERRKEMVKPYVERARSLKRSGPELEQSLAMMRKALRLDPRGDLARSIEAEIAYLEGLLLIERGTPDRFPLKRALELDPSHAGAKEALASLEDPVVEKKSRTPRYVAAGGVGLAALMAMLVLARRRRDHDRPAAPPPPSPSPSPSPSPPESNEAPPGG